MRAAGAHRAALVAAHDAPAATEPPSARPTMALSNEVAFAAAPRPRTHAQRRDGAPRARDGVLDAAGDEARRVDARERLADDAAVDARRRRVRRARADEHGRQAHVDVAAALAAVRERVAATRSVVEALPARGLAGVRGEVLDEVRDVPEAHGRRRRVAVAVVVVQDDERRAAGVAAARDVSVDDDLAAAARPLGLGRRREALLVRGAELRRVVRGAALRRGLGRGLLAAAQGRRLGRAAAGRAGAARRRRGAS